MTFPFLFSFCFCDDEGHGLLLGFFFFLVCRGAIEDDDISVGFLGLLLVLVSVLWVSVLCLSQFFFRSQSLCLSVLPPLFWSPLFSLYRASSSLGGGNSCPPP
jgi:hypothetical protein